MVDLSLGSSPEPAQVTETHISVVLLAGSRAYKLCKPVRLQFLDYSTRERRRRALTRELELNRRFAPDVYLGLLNLVDDSGNVHDHALVMRRMPADRRLTRVLAGGGADAEKAVRDVAKAVAAIHASAPRPSGAADAARRASVSENWVENERQMQGFVGSILDRDIFERIGELQRTYLSGRGPLFERRIASGHAIDGHGDLLAEDIFCLDDGPRILDCLAFDDRLRYGDVLADIAFLAMDVERLAGEHLTRELLRYYGEFSGEHHPSSLADHYIAYRAQVRSKVACLRTAQGDTEAVELARQHLALCHTHLEQARVRFVLIGGPPASGKSTLANALADRTGWLVLRSDELRKEMAGLPLESDASAEFEQGLYRPAAVAATYRELLLRAGRLAEEGETVILDASWTTAEQRAAARYAAARAGAEVSNCWWMRREIWRLPGSRRGEPLETTHPTPRRRLLSNCGAASSPGRRPPASTRPRPSPRAQMQFSRPLREPGPPLAAGAGRRITGAEGNDRRIPSGCLHPTRRGAPERADVRGTAEPHRDSGPAHGRWSRRGERDCQERARNADLERQ